MSTYKHSFYLCFRRRRRAYNSLAVRVTERQPNLDAGEVCVSVSVALPSALFEKPLLKATILVPENKGTPSEIDASVAENIAEVIREQLGINLQITINSPPGIDGTDQGAGK